MSCGNRLFGNLIPVTGGSFVEKPVTIVAGTGIDVQDQSTSQEWRFLVSGLEVDALTVDLVLVAKALTVVKTNPVLTGTVIDEVELTWSYNKAVVSQTLTNTGGLNEPTLDPADEDFEYTSQTITTNTSFTIQGNDGLALDGSIGDDTESIAFGNYMFLGDGLSKIGSATSAIETFVEALATLTVKTARSHTYFATGGTNEHHFVAYPKAWGLATFTKGVFQGGYVRLKNVAGTLKSELGMGDTETDVTITNELGHAEAYYIYESLFDAQDDPVTPFVIS